MYSYLLSRGVLGTLSAIINQSHENRMPALWRKNANRHNADKDIF